jgi:hypothetical protein
MNAAAANRAKQKAFRDKRLAAGACTRCGKPRTELPGHTSDSCAKCAERRREQARNRERTKRGIPIDAPVKVSKGGAKPSPKTKRSDEYNAKLLDAGKPRRKASEILYGSLTLEDIRRATSALPLKPPGK